MLRAITETLAGILGAPVRLEITRNRRVMLSWRREAGGFLVRMHRIFLDAPPETIATLGRHLLRPDGRTRRILHDFTAARHDPTAVPPRRSSQPRLVTSGRHHDLDAFFTRLNAAHFGGAVEARITWGRSGYRRRRSIRLGSWHPELRLIRINRAMDRDFVPEYFVESIVFHEMLHAFLGVSSPGSGRRTVHGRTFREMESAYPERDRAQIWLRANLRNLLRG